MASAARWRNRARLHFDEATPIIGTVSAPRLRHRIERREDHLVREIACHAEEHERVGAGGRAAGGASSQLVAAFSSCPPNCLPHGRQQAIGEIGIAARGEALVKRRARSPAPARLRRWRPRSSNGLRRNPRRGPTYASRAGSSRSAIGGEVQQPGADHAAAAPDFRDLGQVQIVLVVLRVAHRRRLGVRGALPACRRRRCAGC